MTANVQANGDSRRLQPALFEVALITARECAAVGGMSPSWWHEMVRLKRAPRRLSGSPVSHAGGWRRSPPFGGSSPSRVPLTTRRLSRF